MAPMGQGAAVLFRQRFGGLHAGVDGLLAVGVRDGAVYYVSSSLARSSTAPAGASQCRRRPPDRDRGFWPGRSERDENRVGRGADRNRCQGGLPGHPRRRRQRRKRLSGGIRHLSYARRIDPAPRGSGRPRLRQPGVGGLPEHTATRLLLHRHSGALVRQCHGRMQRGRRLGGLAAELGPRTRRPGRR